jgi:DNA-3-methyladenine glycosylase I
MGDDIPVKTGLIESSDGVVRCSWPGTLPEYIHYHDHEWGRPVTDDTRLFEKVCLEGFQSGLSWLTILRKRQNFREAFDGFDYHKIARYTDKDVERLLANAGIIRHRGKINSAINNANRALELVRETGSLAAYFWSFEPPAEERPQLIDYATLIANPTTPTSVRLSKDLKKRGWSFVGPTTMYAHMQAMGLVNDHVEGCTCRREIETIRAKFKRPKCR